VEEVVGEVSHFQMEPFQEEGEEEGASLKQLEEVVVVEEVQMLLKIKDGHLLYLVRAAVVELTDLPVTIDYQSGWSL
jgi:hypothetical protein